MSTRGQGHSEERRVGIFPLGSVVSWLFDVLIQLAMLTADRRVSIIIGRFQEMEQDSKKKRLVTQKKNFLFVKRVDFFRRYE